jgi:predicted dehydrogenase
VFVADQVVRVGIVGIGGMGSSHAKYLSQGEVSGAKLAAVCDIDPDRLKSARERFGESIKCFDNHAAMFASGEIDAVMVATPHYDHPPICIAALKAGIHALSEKPAGVYTSAVRELNAVAEKSGRVFGIMFNQRTRADHQKLRDLVASGELGEVRRTMYVITDWLRTQSYYDSGGWRGTWAGEGGGVLMNQAPHNLDLFQWIAGMPCRVRAFCKFGRYHNIEVDDDVTAYVEYPNGASGVFITTTGETPGRNFFEIVADRGSVLMEGGKITFRRTRKGITEHINTCPGGFDKPETWTIDIPGGSGPEHKGITQNWINAIRTGSPLLASGTEGIHGLMLGNAMLMSTWIDNWVDLPLDEARYEAMVKEKAATSRFKKPATGGKALNFSGTF